MLEEPPDTGRLYAPLRAAGVGITLRLFRDRAGTRCAVGFTSAEQLERVLGPDQPYYLLTESMVRSLARERGVSTLIVDPRLAAAPVEPLQPLAEVELPREARRRSPWDRELTGMLAVSAVGGAIALLMQVIP